MMNVKIDESVLQWFDHIKILKNRKTAIKVNGD